MRDPQTDVVLGALRKIRDRIDSLLKLFNGDLEERSRVRAFMEEARVQGKSPFVAAMEEFEQLRKLLEGSAAATTTTMPKQ